MITAKISPHLLNKRIKKESTGLLSVLISRSCSGLRCSWNEANILVTHVQAIPDISVKTAKNKRITALQKSLLVAFIKKGKKLLPFKNTDSDKNTLEFDNNLRSFLRKEFGVQLKFFQKQYVDGSLTSLKIKCFVLYFLLKSVFQKLQEFGC